MKFKCPRGEIVDTKDLNPCRLRSAVRVPRAPLQMKKIQIISDKNLSL